MVMGTAACTVHAHDPKQAGCNGKLPVLFFSATATARLATKLPIGFDEFYAYFAVALLRRAWLYFILLGVDFVSLVNFIRTPWRMCIIAGMTLKA